MRLAAGVRKRSIVCVDVFTDRSVRAVLQESLTSAKAMAGARPPAGQPPVDGPKLLSRFVGATKDQRLVDIPANRRPWTPSGIRVERGDRVTWLAWGRAYAMTQRGIGTGPSFGMLCRVGDGPVQMSARPTYTFTADRDGEVLFGGRLPAELQPNGEVKTDRIPFGAMRGGFTAVVVVWHDASDPLAELKRFASLDSSGLCTVEHERLSAPPEPPPGWFHHPLLGREDVYASTADTITVDCEDTVGIIRRPVELDLTDQVSLRWSWRVDRLPSSLPENTMFTHDYVSIAAEFDDGRDLTWQWSSTLPLGLAYRCPLDHWRHRETHIVVRSGSSELGSWVTDERPVLADARSAIGGQAPRRVVAVWLIAVSLNQHGSAVGAFRDIELHNGSEVTTI